MLTEEVVGAQKPYPPTTFIIIYELELPRLIGQAFAGSGAQYVNGRCCARRSGPPTIFFFLTFKPNSY